MKLLKTVHLPQFFSWVPLYIWVDLITFLYYVILINIISISPYITMCLDKWITIESKDTLTQPNLIISRKKIYKIYLFVYHKLSIQEILCNCLNWIFRKKLSLNYPEFLGFWFFLGRFPNMVSWIKVAKTATQIRWLQNLYS